ncbi:MAG TPA: hypothetical protein P5556_03425 [Candidatus Gastranaerophilales bacterium]|nr:hypothetical protein [Candidatus Gastranaerophilales bacterium]
MKILFIGDFLRLSEINNRPNQNGNVQWWCKLLGCNLADLNFQVNALLSEDYIISNNTPANFYNGKKYNILTINTENIYKSFNLEQNINSWLEIHDKTIDEINSPLINDIINLISQYDLVFGFELSPYIRSILEKSGTCYVEGMLHPIRFYKDIIYAIKTNHPELKEKIFNARLKYKDIVDYCKFISAKCEHRLSRLTLKENSAVFFGQSFIDKSLYKNGKIIKPDDFRDKLFELAQNYEILYVKPHPYNRHEDFFKVFNGLGKNIEIINENAYKILSHAAVKKAATLTSSIGIEAKLFGKEVEFYSEYPFPVYEVSSQNADDFIAVDSDYFYHYSFMEYLFSGGELKSGNYQGLIRKSLAQNWGFDVVDELYELKEKSKEQIL